MPQPTCHWRTAESLSGKDDVPAPERLSVTCKSMDLTSSPCRQHHGPALADSNSLLHVDVCRPPENSRRLRLHQCSYPLFFFYLPRLSILPSRSYMQLLEVNCLPASPSCAKTTRG